MIAVDMFELCESVLEWSIEREAPEHQMHTPVPEKHRILNQL